MLRFIYHTGLFFLGLSFLAACGDCDGGEPPKVDWELQKLYQEANQSLAENDLEKAESDLRQVLHRDSGHLGALSKLAWLLEERASRSPKNRVSMLNEALKLIDHALEIKHDSKKFLEEKVKVAKLAGKLDEALDASRQLLKLEPSDLKYTVGMSQILQKQGKTDAAEKLLLAEIKRDDGSIRLQLGRMKLESGEIDAARKFFNDVPSCPKRGDELKPRACPSLHFYNAQDELGSMAIKSGKFDEAEKIYASLVKMFPEDSTGWEVLAALLEKRKDWKDAQDAYRKSLAVDRSRSSAWLGLGRCLFALAKKDDATFAFRKAENFLAKDPSLALDMADDLLKMGEGDWAKSVLERAKILAADDVNLQKLLDKKIHSLTTEKNSDIEKPLDNKKPDSK